MSEFTTHQVEYGDTRIYIAGDAADAERICREFCFDVGLRVTVTPTTYIYTGGQESGVIVGLTNYPRFPKPIESIELLAMKLGEKLCRGLFQRSFSVSAPAETIWCARRDA